MNTKYNSYAPVTLALPSKGALAQPTLNFLQDCGLAVWKPNPRQYTGNIPAVEHLDVMFQRVKDVVYKVADGSAQLGITGLDVVREYADENVMVIHNDLNYGHCQLVVAVPEAWVDVENIADLADVALDIREEQHRDLRIATTYTTSSRRFLHENGIHHFSLVKADGAIEAAPTLGYADAVIDLTQTGTTLRENRLKMLEDGTIITSQACLIANQQALEQHPQLMRVVKILLEYIDGALNGKRYYQLSANAAAESQEQIIALLSKYHVTADAHGVSVVPASQDGNRYTLTLSVLKRDMLAVVEYIRQLGGNQITVQPVRFVFLDESPTYSQLKTKLQPAQPDPTPDR